MFQHDAGHSGLAPVQIGVPTLTPRWSVGYGTAPNSGVTTGSGKVFFSTSDGVLVALDANTGVEVWRKSFPSTVVNPPSYWNGKVYVQTINFNDSWLRCYDADTGAVVFRTPHGAQFEHYLAPTIWNGTVYVHAGQFGGMFAFDALSGALVWSNTTLEYISQRTPTVSADAAYAYSDRLRALSLTTGAVQYEILDPNYDPHIPSLSVTPVLGGLDDALVVQNGRLLRFDLVGRRIALELNGSFVGQPAVKDGVIYVIGSGSLQARDERDGTLLWMWSVPTDALRETFSLTLGHALVHTFTDTYAVDLRTHQRAWSYPNAGDVAVAQGALYLSTLDGHITAIGFASPPVPASVEPPFQPWVSGPSQVSIHGSAFLVDPAGIQVTIGGTAATNVTVVSDQLLQCTVPLTAPGVYRVELANAFGRGVLEDGFALTPAVQILAVPHPNETLDIRYFQDPHHQLLALIGFGQAQPRPYAPFQGTLCMDPAEAIGFLFLPGWFQPMFPVGMAVPNDPNLTGVHVLLQSVAGPSLWNLDGAFSNCVAFTIP